MLASFALHHQLMMRTVPGCSVSGEPMGIHALVVDDEPKVVELVTAMLTSKGFTVTTASDGVEALTKVRERPPDILLLDIMMPKMDGASLAEKLRESSATRRIPLVFLTGLVNAGETKRRGDHLYLGKPFDTAQLLEVIERAIKEAPDRS